MKTTMDKRGLLQSVPEVDFQNPFYCPAVPAATYIKTLRRTATTRNAIRMTDSHRESDLFGVFARMLERYDGDDSDVEYHYDPQNDWIIGRNRRPAKRRQYTSPLIMSGRPAFRPSHAGSLESEVSNGSGSFDLSQSTVRPQTTTLKRKREASTFSDLLGTPKYARSSSFVQDDSFEFEARRERIRFDVTSSPAHTLATPQAREQGVPFESVVEKIEALLPGYRIRTRFRTGSHVQHLVDFLAERGLITPPILDVLRETSITCLALAASLADEDGLNICGPDMLKIFETPRSFLCLTEICFAGSRIVDHDLIHIHHLPKLSGLYLNNTGIGNEAVFLLVPLKHTLTKLSVATNPDINSDCVPALLILKQLAFLSILDTCVDMVGLRRLALAACEGHYTAIDIEIPCDCDTYIENIEKMYLVNPQPPLITDPSACSSLTTTALRVNLTAHANRNPAISAAGTHEEMAERLKEILTRREMDLVVAQMLRG
ncbi:hypothetical protein BKA70DRAFT_1562190 [Coprinopsis sp. MPI-PUGE-AT-0042]|nr:hypothetical protein BKA70DRAFT_1562190 [Coprinopsis sp. MPI-PUGE-AT-0042]